MPSVHQSVFTKPGHEVRTVVRWQDEHMNTPYAEVHFVVDTFQVVYFVDQAKAPEYALAMYSLAQGLLRPNFGVWNLKPRTCPLCSQPEPLGEVHQECAEREAMEADRA